jgi:ActR/RegA family two-component response regulator
MHMKKTAKFVLLLDADSATIRQSATNLAGSDGYVLIARSPAAAVEFAKQYKPAYAVVAKSQTAMDGTALQDLLLEFSPETEIVLISSEEAQAAVGQSA